MVVNLEHVCCKSALKPVLTHLVSVCYTHFASALKRKAMRTVNNLTNETRFGRGREPHTAWPPQKSRVQSTSCRRRAQQPLVRRDASAHPLTQLREALLKPWWTYHQRSMGHIITDWHTRTALRTRLHCRTSRLHFARFQHCAASYIYWLVCTSIVKQRNSLLQ